MKHQLLDRLWRMHCAHLKGTAYLGLPWDTHLHMDENDQVSHYGFMLHLAGFTFRTLSAFPPETVTDAEILMIVHEHFSRIVEQVENLCECKDGKYVPKPQNSSGLDTQVGGPLRTVQDGVSAKLPNGGMEASGKCGTACDAPDGENGIPL
jgi:hypothetical protein